MERTDRSVLEAVSWRLASELVRRHPSAIRLIRGDPKGGMSDLLWLSAKSGQGGDVRLNRMGAITVWERFDGRPADAWPETSWDEYLWADPYDFLERLEAAAGLPAPSKVPAATPTTLTYRVLAAIASTAVKSVEPVDIQMGFMDTTDYGNGPNKALAVFTSISEELLAPGPDDFWGEAGYRFWILVRAGDPVLAFEQEQGRVFTRHHQGPFDLMHLYEESRRHLLVTALKLFRRVDQV